MHPAEFRIHRTQFVCDDDSTFLSLIDLIARLLESGDEKGGKDRADINRVMAEVGTGLWRLRRKLVQPGTDRPHDETRGAYRHLESVWDALKQHGIEIRDHTDEPVPETGTYALKVITYQPTAGLTRERVVETIKPSIYWNSDTLQVGEVIVGTPIAST